MPVIETLPDTQTAVQESSSSACKVCGGEARVSVAGPPTLVHCARCALTSLETFPDAAQRESLYQEDYYSQETGARFLAVFELAISTFRWLRYRSIALRTAGRGAILDVGCGRGDLLEVFQRRGWRVLGTQLSRTAARAAREQRGVDVVCGELPDLVLSPRRFDVITFFHVLEHIASPETYLRTARDLLSDDGLLVVEVPDCSSPGFRLLKTRNFCLDYPHHLVFFTSASLRALLVRCGFRAEGVSNFSLEYSPFTTLQNILNLLPGKPSRLYRSFMRNAEGRSLRRSPWTWFHYILGSLLAAPAFVLSLLGLLFPCGNTVRFYCRNRD